MKDKKISFMGILNATPDSFSDGGSFVDIDKALYHCKRMIEEGADIIDIGGESSRPGSDGVSLSEELDRVIPIIEKVKEEFDIVVSIDTVKSEVARIAVFEHGVDIINDISALKGDENMARVVSESDVPVILMHMKGKPKNMQDKPFYDDVLAEIEDYFEERIGFSVNHGIKKENIILDPGIGFGKRLEDNVNIIKGISKFKKFNLPILIGLSRKRFLGEISGEVRPIDRDYETAMANIISIQNGASIIRTHNIAATIRSMKIFDELIKN